MLNRWMIDEDDVDERTRSAMYELGQQILEALHRKAYAEECLAEALRGDDENAKGDRQTRDDGD